MSSAIHAEDEMYLYGLQALGDPALARSNYFRQGSEIHAAVQRLLDWRFSAGQLQAVKVLDFACGYGRATRFLASRLPPANIWVSDIYAGAVAFQQATFGVKGFVSQVEPDQVHCEGGFDLIFVASLFTHLPQHRFHQWLARLFDWLSPQGLLAFSVHDQAMLTGPEGPAMPAQGFLFLPQSESRSLDTAEYGATYVTADFMRRAVARLSGPAHPSRRLPRGLCREHDLYLVARDPGIDLGGLDWRTPPIGYVEGMQLSADGVLELSGWAGDADAQAAVRLELLLDERPVPAEAVWLERPDVVAAIGAPGLARSGWHLRAAGFDLGRDLDRDVALEVVDRQGVRTRLGHAQLRVGLPPL